MVLTWTLKNLLKLGRSPRGEQLEQSSAKPEVEPILTEKIEVDIEKKWDWAEVQNVLLSQVTDSRDLRSFVVEAITNTPYISTLFGLASSPISAPFASECFSNADFGPDGPFWAHMKSSHYCAGLLSAVVIAKSHPGTVNMLSRVRALFPLPSSNFATIVDSFGSRLAEQPSDAHLRTLNTSLDPEASEHTLLLAPATDGQMQSLSVLFGNAKKVTVLSPTTLSERAGLNQLPLHHQPSEVRIEAARTRIGRYSRECQRLHLMTWEAAAKIINKVDATFDGVWGAARPFAETWLSDELFFEALKASSVAKLIRDENFDRIVVAVDGSPASAELCGVLGTVEGFASDPRVVVASLALTENARLRFGDEISAILGNAHGAPNKRRALVSSAIVDMLKVRGKELVGGFKQFPVAGRPRILFATAPEPSYNAASASYFLELQKNYDCIFSSINPGVSSQIDYDTSGEVQHISQPVSNNADLALWLYTAIDEVEIDTETPRLVANILRSKGRSFAQHSIQGFLQLWITIQQWFEAMEAVNGLPHALVVTPVRNSRVMLIAAAARQKQVPSLSLEPHIQRTTYCRYGHVLTDYFGVMSVYLQRIAEGDERIDNDRCRVVGSPRIIGERQYDYAQRTEVARARLMTMGIDFDSYTHTISFFSQSTEWGQINAVWEIILAATEGLGVQVLLKGHPEEGPARMDRYLTTALRLGAQDRVKCIASHAAVTDIIESSDMVLSCFSTVLLEAVLCRRPTAAVVNGAFDYPTATHEVAGVPLFRDENALRRAIDGLPNEFGTWQSLISKYLAEEGQFLGEMGFRLGALVDEMVQQPKARSLRKSLPSSVFLSSLPPAFEI